MVIFIHGQPSTSICTQRTVDMGGKIFIAETYKLCNGYWDYLNFTFFPIIP